MGPQASAYLLQKLVFLSRTLKLTDTNFPHIILDSMPIPNFMLNLQNSHAAQSMIEVNIEKLEYFNPKCFAIACNTAHILLSDLKKITTIPFVSIIDEVITKVESSGLHTVGILASPTTIKSHLYQHALFEREIDYLTPTKKECIKLAQIIRCILDNKNLEGAKIELSYLADTLAERGAEGIILGCTELPLLFEKTNSYQVFDSVEILAQALYNLLFL